MPLMMVASIGTLLLVWRQPNFLRTALHPGILARSLLDIGSTLFAFAALIYMTLANFAAVIMVSPLILTLLAIVFFRERVGWRRWLAIVVGLFGALIIVNPNPADFDPYSAFALLCVLCSASRDLVTTRLHTRATTLTIIFVSAVVVMLGGFAKGYWETWQPLTTENLLLLAGSSAFLTGGNFLIVVAFRSAAITTVSPFRYTAMLWSPIIGYIVFHDIPDHRFLIGGALIVGAGLYTLHRERVRHRYLAAAAPLPEAER